MRKKTIIANWKANPTTNDEAKTLFKAEVEIASKYDSVQTVICPPFVYLEPLSTLHSSSTHLGAQDMYWESSGAHTGGITTKMLLDLGVKYVLIGHSERRAIGETDEMINNKLKASLEVGITPVFLIGEQEHNDAIRQDIIVDQLTRGLEGINPKYADRIFYTYEPSWAISSKSGGRADDTEGIVSGIELVKQVVIKHFNLQSITYNLLPILYGGSVNGTNANQILSLPQVSGVVVGSASLDPDRFEKVLYEITA